MAKPEAGAETIRPTSHHWLFLTLLLSAFFYLLVVALAPLPALHLSETPLLAWSWTTLPNQWFITLWRPLGDLRARTEQVSPWLLALALTGLTVAYAWAGYKVFKETRLQQTGSRRYLLLILVGVLICGSILLFLPYLFSDDVFTQIFSGRLLLIYHVDPLSTIPAQFPDDPYFRWLVSSRDRISFYAPLWLRFSEGLTWFSGQPVITLLLFKGCALAGHLLNTLLVWNLLGLIAPRRRLLGTLLFAWNPLLILELAGNGHNEWMLILWFLLALWAYVHAYQLQQAERKRYFWQRPLFWRLLYCLCLGLAISTNLIALLVTPLFLWFDMREEGKPGRATARFVGQLLLTLLPLLFLIWPLWHGAETFIAITASMDLEHFVQSPIGLFAWPIRGFFEWATSGAKGPLLIAPIKAADVALRASATFIFIVIYFNLFTRVWGSRSVKRHGELIAGMEVVLECWGIAIFWYMVLVAGWFWPWYLLWVLWLPILQRPHAFNIALLVLSGTALFVYPFTGFSKGPLSTQQTALIFGLPLVYLLLVFLFKKRRRRKGIAL
jgi:hypothetical protein